MGRFIRSPSTILLCGYIVGVIEMDSHLGVMAGNMESCVDIGVNVFFSVALHFFLGGIPFYDRQY